PIQWTARRTFLPNTRYVGSRYTDAERNDYVFVEFSYSAGLRGGEPATYPWWVYSNRVIGLTNKFVRTNPMDVPSGPPAANTHRISWDTVEWAHGVDLIDQGRTLRLYEPGIWDVDFTAVFQTMTGATRATAWVGSPSNPNDVYKSASINPTNET